MGNTLVNCLLPCGNTKNKRVKIGPSTKSNRLLEYPIDEDFTTINSLMEDSIAEKTDSLDTIVEHKEKTDSLSSSSSSSQPSRIYVLSSLDSESEHGPEYDTDCASDFSMCQYPYTLYVGRTSPKRTPSRDTDGDWGETPPRSLRKLDRFSPIAPLSKNIISWERYSI